MLKRVITSAGLSLLLVIVSGCGSLPDGKPFADATGTWSASVRTAGQTISDSLKDAGNVDLQDKNKYELQVKAFEKAWAVRVNAAQAVVTYSYAIVDLMAASKEGGETVKKVSDALTNLAGSLSIPLANAPVGVAGDLARFVLDRIAIVRASKELEEAMSAAQPAVNRIADQLILEADAQLKPILRDVYGNIISGIKSQYEDDDNFAKAFSRKRAGMRAEALKDVSKVSQLQELDKVQAAVTLRLKERDQKIDQAADAYKSRLQLINALSTATRAWAAAHRDLASAVREKRKVNVAELQETVSELKDLIRKVRAI